MALSPKRIVFGLVNQGHISNTQCDSSAPHSLCGPNLGTTGGSITTTLHGAAMILDEDLQNSMAR